MPQLNPSPWFPILILSWLTLLTIIPKKILAYFFSNELSSRTEKIKTKPWNWLWH